MEFAQRSGNGPPAQPADGGGVGGILAAYGVEPSARGAAPEMDDDEDETPSAPVSSGHGSSPNRYRHSMRMQAATVAASCNFSSPFDGVADRGALVNKYPALRDGTGL